MADHFYTTDPAGELALTSGYWLEGIACHVFPNKSTNTTSFFRWLNPGGDHFYTTHPGGEEAPQAGYGMEGVACNVFSSPQQFTTPFFRWFSPVSGDHFYTTDPNGNLPRYQDTITKGLHAMFIHSFNKTRCHFTDGTIPAMGITFIQLIQPGNLLPAWGIHRKE
jgi:hypothetical protein